MSKKRVLTIDQFIEWGREGGKKSGKVKSEKKQEASRINGAKGGRPKKKV